MMERTAEILADGGIAVLQHDRSRGQVLRPKPRHEVLP